MKFLLRRRVGVRLYRREGGAFLLQVLLVFLMVQFHWYYPDLSTERKQTGLMLGWIAMNHQPGTTIPCRKWMRYRDQWQKKTEDRGR